MAPITFPTSSNPGLRPQESAGRLINAFVEKSESGAPGQTLWRRSPGLIFAGSGTTDHTRGFHACRDTDQLATGNRGWATAYWVTNGALHLLTELSTGEYSVNFIAPLGGEEPVTFGRNHAFPEPQVVVCTDPGGGGGSAHTLLLSPSAAPVDYVDIDTDLPPNPTSVCGAHGYFVWSYQNGRIYASDLNSTAVAADSFNSESHQSEQGQAVLRVVWFSNRLYAFGDKWTGIYRDAGAQPFPFLREGTIPRGIVSTHAVAGWETGWPNELIWVGNDYIVYKLNGMTPVPISNDAVSRKIQEAVLTNCVLEAFVYMYGRNAFWVLNANHLTNPHQFAWTWEYNATTGQWNERQSWTLPNWRGHRSIKGSKEWLVGDAYATGFYRIREEFFYDEIHGAGQTGVPLVWTIESGVMSGFPNRTVIPRASFNISAGVGNSMPPHPLFPSNDPKVKIYWSLDGGATWGLPVERRMGPQGDHRYYPSVISSGLSRGHGIRYRLVVEDAVHVGLSGGEIEVQPRAPI